MQPSRFALPHPAAEQTGIPGPGKADPGGGGRKAPTRENRYGAAVRARNKPPRSEPLKLGVVSRSGKTTLVNATRQTLRPTRVCAPSRLATTDKVRLLNRAGAENEARYTAALRSSRRPQREGWLSRISVQRTPAFRQMPPLRFTDEETEVPGGPVTYLRYHSVHWSANRQCSSLLTSSVLAHWGRAGVFTGLGRAFRGRRDGPLRGASDCRGEAAPSSAAESDAHRAEKQ